MAAADHDHIEPGGKLHRFGQKNKPKPIGF